MKHIYNFIWISILLLSGCDQKGNGQEKKDYISLSLVQEVIDYKPQTVKVTVSSSQDWTLEQYDCDWAVPSVTNGASGDVVEFDVEKNTTGSMDLKLVLMIT